MISKLEENEYTYLIADLMITLDQADEFVVKFWISGNDLPFSFTDRADFCFMQEGVRIEVDGRVNYLFYDNIDNIQVLK